MQRDAALPFYCFAVFLLFWGGVRPHVPGALTDSWLLTVCVTVFLTEDILSRCRVLAAIAGPTLQILHAQKYFAVTSKNCIV